MRLHAVLLLLALSICLSACARPAAPAVYSPPPAPSPSVTAAPSAQAVYSPPPTSIATPPPTAAPISTATATSTPTSTPTLHPMMIAALRQTPYSGSDLVIEQELSPGAHSRRYLVSYRSEGLKLYALLALPYGDPSPGGWPGIILNHGYIPPAEYRTGRRYVAYVDRIAQGGYLVLQPDYRGHDRSEGEPGGMGQPGYVADVLNALAALRRYPQADPARMGMWGHSMGGYLTLRAMVIAPEIKAGVIWAGVVASYADLYTGWRRDRPTPAVTGTPYPYARDWRGWSAEFGGPDENPAFWSAISANSYLADLSGPLQLHHGTADASVPLTFTLTLEEQLAAAGQPFETYLYADEDHNLSGSLGLALDRSVAFFDRYVKGE